MRTYKLSESQLPLDKPFMMIIDEDILIVFEDEIESNNYINTYAELMYETKYDENGNEIPQV